MARTVPHDRRPGSRRGLLLALVLAAGSAPLTRATVYGVDERNLPDSHLTEEEQRTYVATQVIYCERSDGRWRAGAGSLVGDFRHGVTVAHLFFDESTRTHFPASRCTFRVYDREGRKLDEVALTRRRSWWETHEPDPGNDLAMFELARSPMFVYRLLPLVLAPVRDGERLLLVTYHYDVKPEFSKRKTRGRVYPTIGTKDDGVPNVFHTDVDCVPMSSGGPLFNDRGELVGFIRAGTSSGTGPPLTFDPLREFNIAVRIPAAFRDEYTVFRGSAR
ncbi:MAG TPA: serine protease [Steroidobacteraceae bacterium]|nr:serine protease [Steroidobacteraceae bacterium]